MTNAHLNEIKERLRRLLAVAKEGSNATEAEVESAIMFASRLMAKHHLSEEDLDQGHTVEELRQAAVNARKGMYHATVGRQFHAWEDNLAMFVGDFVGCGIYSNSNKRTARYPDGRVYVACDEETTHVGKSYVFFGIAEDAAFAVTLYYELWTTVWQAGMWKFGKIYKGDGGLYCEGFVRGMADATLKEKRQALLVAPIGTRGLMVIEERARLVELKKDIANQWLSKEQGVKLRKNYQGKRGASGSDAAYHEGKADGASQNVTRTSTPKLG